MRKIKQDEMRRYRIHHDEGRHLQRKLIYPPPLSGPHGGLFAVLLPTSLGSFLAVRKIRHGFRVAISQQWRRPLTKQAG